MDTDGSRSQSPALDGLSPPLERPPLNGTQSSYNGTTFHDDDSSSHRSEDHTGATTPEESPPSPRTDSQYPRISLPVELMRDSYHVVVIGTGYGGGVAASRMARGRQSVCVLERGKERWPGEYPESLADAAREVRISGEFAPGDRRSVPGKLVGGGNATGMYHFATGDGQNVFMGNGLGGTSLVNANVFLEATPAVLDMEIWPEELRGRDKWAKCELRSPPAHKSFKDYQHGKR